MDEPKTAEAQFNEFISGLPGDLRRNLEMIEPVLPVGGVSETVLQSLREGKNLETARQWDNTIAEMTEKLDAPLFKAAESIRNRPSWTPLPAEYSRSYKV